MAIHQLCTTISIDALAADVSQIPSITLGEALQIWLQGLGIQGDMRIDLIDSTRREVNIALFAPPEVLRKLEPHVVEIYDIDALIKAEGGFSRELRH